MKIPKSLETIVKEQRESRRKEPPAGNATIAKVSQQVADLQEDVAIILKLLEATRGK